MDMFYFFLKSLIIPPKFEKFDCSSKVKMFDCSSKV